MSVFSKSFNELPESPSPILWTRVRCYRERSGDHCFSYQWSYTTQHASNTLMNRWAQLHPSEVICLNQNQNSQTLIKFSLLELWLLLTRPNDERMPLWFTQTVKSLCDPSVIVSETRWRGNLTMQRATGTTSLHSNGSIHTHQLEVCLALLGKCGCWRGFITYLFQVLSNFEEARV